MSSPRQPVGWVRGPLYYVPYFGDYWYTPSLLGTIQQTATQLGQTAERTNRVLADPSGFVSQAVQGAIQGVSQTVSQPSRATPSEREHEGEEGEIPRILESSDPPSLFNGVQRLLSEGASKAAAVGLEQLLLHARTEDASLLEGALESLNRARVEGASLPETAKSVWESLNSRHIVWGGVHLNAKRSSNKILRDARLEAEREGKSEELLIHDTDGTSPINSLIRCQELFQTLSAQHKLSPPAPSTSLPPSESPSQTELVFPVREDEPSASREEIERLQQRTDETIHRFCEKTVHYSTMYAMRTLFSQEIPPEEFNQMIQQGGNLEARYLNRVGGGVVRQFMYKHIYRLILKLISPIIQETIEGVTTHLRDFLKDDVQMLKFAEAKIRDLSNYYGRIERGRQDYVRGPRSDNPGYEAGSFDEFLSMTIRNYGENRLTEAELIKRFGDYIVSNYTPRPHIQIGGYRIPLISKLLEWVVHSIRKGLIRFFLQRTQLIDTILTRGTSSAQYAQLGLKKMLLTKLKEIVNMIQRSRPRDVTDLTEEEAPTRSRLEAKKARLITRNLHQVIQQHSRNLHRFIEIQECKNKDEPLRNLDSRINTLTSEILSSVHHLFQWEPVTFQGILEDATTNLLETSLLSLFEDKERQIESQMQGIFEVLERTYEYTSPESQVTQEYRHREELRNIDNQLNELLEQLSRLAIEAAAEDHLKNASVERHRKIEEFVVGEKNEMIELGRYLYSLNSTLLKMINEHDYDNSNIHEIKEQLNEAVCRIEGFLRRTAAILRGKELKAICYSDVRGDLYNAYAIQIKILEKFALETLNPLLIKIKEIEQQEQLVLRYAEAHKRLETLSYDYSAEELITELEEIRLLLPESDRSALDEPFRAIRENWLELDRLNSQQRLLNQEAQLQRDQDAYSQQLQQLNTVRRDLGELADLLVQYRNQRGAGAEEGRMRLVQEIQRRYSGLIQINDPSLHQYVLDLIRSDNTGELYKKLHPPKWSIRSEVPVFTALNRYQLLLQEQIRKIGQQRENLRPQTESLNAEEIQENKSSLIRQMQPRIELGLNTIAGMVTHPAETFLGMLLEITEYTKRFEEVGCQSALIADNLKVSAYIAVGELKLAQNITPIATTIAPRISESITHLLDSLGEPFHYKQLILRLVILDIVRRNETS